MPRGPLTSSLPTAPLPGWRVGKGGGSWVREAQTRPPSRSLSTTATHCCPALERASPPPTSLCPPPPLTFLLLQENVLIFNRLHTVGIEGSLSACMNEKIPFKGDNRISLGGPVVKNLPENAEDNGSIPGQGRSHTPAGQPSLCTATLEPGF